MNILHLNTYQIGGAALCAIRINHALEQQGVESKMLFAYGDVLPKDVKGDIARRDYSWLYSNIILRKALNFCSRHVKGMNAVKLHGLLSKANSNNLFLHHPFSNYKSIVNHPLIEWADIIHLHWVADFVDYPSFFREIKKPIVWTLHDVFPAYGTFHFLSTQSSMSKELLEWEKKLKRIKRMAIEGSNIHIVAISELMRQICEQSDVLCGFPVTLIHNGVNTDVFVPQRQKRNELTFLFSAYDIWDQRKGLVNVISALERLDVQEKKLIIIGSNDKQPKIKAPFCIEQKGFISNPSELSKIYSNADFFINASYEEGFAQAPLEAMACGTPVISTPCSGATDLIMPFNGIICKGFDSNSLLEGIKAVLSNQYDSVIIRNHIVENYNYDIIARQYIKLYESIIKAKY